MAIDTFIPTVWSEHLLNALDRKYVAVANCNREYEGDIREKGNTVKICGLNPIMVSNYTKNSNMTAPQALSDTYMELKIDQAKYFNFQIDDIDRAQTQPKLMDLALKNAANALANTADSYVLGLITKADTQIECGQLSADTILDKILSARTKILSNSDCSIEDIVLEVSPEVAECIFKAKLTSQDCNTELMENGCIGNIFGCKVFVTKNIHRFQVDDYNSTQSCVMRTKRAIAYAEQLSEVDAYRPELRFADAVKGLHLYGAKIVYQNEILALNFSVPVNQN